MNTHKIRMAAFVLAAGLSGTAQAALHDRGGGLIYDDVLNVTWQQEANLSRTQSFGVSYISSQAGTMTWYNAQTWLAAMNAANYLGYSDWRFPTVKPINGVAFNDQFSTNGTTDVGFNITSVNSEMAHLANVDLIGMSQTCSPDSPVAPPNCSQVNIGLFKNIQLVYAYISGADVYPGSDDYRAFVFNSPVSVNSVSFNYGYQGIAGKGYGAVAMVLRDGDVAAVPEPETYAMLLAGLGLVGAIVRRRKQAGI